MKKIIIIILSLPLFALAILGSVFFINYLSRSVICKNAENRKYPLRNIFTNQCQLISNPTRAPWYFLGCDLSSQFIAGCQAWEVHTK